MSGLPGSTSGRARPTAVTVALGSVTVAVAFVGAQLLVDALVTSVAETPAIALANGILMASLAATPYRTWPAQIGACGAASILAWLAAGDAGRITPFVHIIEASVGAMLFRRYGGGIGNPMTLGRAAACFAIVTLAAAPLGALLGAVSTLEVGQSAWVAFRAWWFADVLGMLAVTPAVLGIAAEIAETDDYERVPLRPLESIVFAAIMIPATLWVFSLPPEPTRNLGDAHYIAFLPVVVAAFRLRPWMTLSTIVLLAVLGGAQTLGGFGPFVVAGQDPITRTLAFQIPTLATAASVQILVTLANERRLAARLDREAAARFRDMVETANEWMWEVDADLRCIYSSPHCLDILGVAPEEVRGVHLLELIHEDDHPAFLQLLRDYVSVRAPISNFRHRYRRRDGSIAFVEANAVPIVDQEGELRGYRGTHRDVTARIEAELADAERRARAAQSEKLVALGTVAAGVAHEVNNPNQFISLNVPMLRRAWEDVEPAIRDYRRGRPGWTIGGVPAQQAAGEFREVIDDIADGSDRIREIVAELRDYVRGETSEPYEIVQPNEIVRRATRMVRDTLQSQRVHLELALEEDAPPIYGSPGRLEQVLTNLLLNASESLGPDGGRVEVRTGPALDTSLYPIAVADEGRGISPEERKRVFEPFYTTRREKGGTGLGLAISERIAREHGGRLELESKPGAGTTARLLIPVAR